MSAALGGLPWRRTPRIYRFIFLRVLKENLIIPHKSSVRVNSSFFVPFQQEKSNAISKRDWSETQAQSGNIIFQSDNSNVSQMNVCCVG